MQVLSIINKTNKRQKFIYKHYSKILRRKNRFLYIETCLDILRHFLNLIGNKSGDGEAALRQSVFRGYSSLQAALLLAMSGHEMAAMSLLRDTIEVEILLDYFIKNPKELEIWWNCNRQTRLSKYNPSALRKAVTKDKNQLKRLNADYIAHCEIGTHPTPVSMVLDSSQVKDNKIEDSLHIYTSIIEVTFHAGRLTRPVAYIGSTLYPNSSRFFSNRMANLSSFSSNFHQDEKIAASLTLFRLRKSGKQIKGQIN